MRDDGVTGVPSIEVNTDNDAAVRNLPTLRNIDVALLASDLGTKYTFKLYVTNSEGSVSSLPISFLFATEPETPTTAPTILEYSSEDCYISYLFVDQIQGSDLISHNLQYRDDIDNQWIDLAGNADLLNLATLWTFTVVKGT
jgi:hypothetical protein